MSTSAAFAEEVLQRDALNLLLIGNELRIGGQIGLQAPHDRRDARGFAALGDKEFQRFRQPDHESERDHERQHAAEQKDRLTAECREGIGVQKAADKPPKGNADQTALATMARRRVGANSEANAMKQGVAPPMPIPAAKRMARSCP